MRVTVAAVVMLFLPSAVSFAADTQSFDGSWLTTVSCDVARDALGYSYQFVSMVRNGVLHGLHGTEGQPSSLKIDGTIAPDGTSKLYAVGHTGSREYDPGAGYAKRHRVQLQHRGSFRRLARFRETCRGPYLHARVYKAVSTLPSTAPLTANGAGGTEGIGWGTGIRT